VASRRRGAGRRMTARWSEAADRRRRSVEGARDRRDPSAPPPWARARPQTGSSARPPPWSGRELHAARGRLHGVTEPPKIVPYYRLSLSTWPLSNNKELFCRFRRVKPGKSHTTGSLICAKPTRRRDQSTILHYIKVHKFNIITSQVFRT
jgi:hypothetical protein